MIFTDRADAGRQLAKKLSAYQNDPSVIVLGLPRGGVITAHEVAKIIKAPLDIIVPRKIGAPFSAELAVGAITEDGEPILDENLIASLNITRDYLAAEIEKEKTEAARRLKKYRADQSNLDLKNKIAILVDDGIATGATMRAAISSVKNKNAKKVIVAVPVLPADTKKIIEKECDQLIYLNTPFIFFSVGEFYKQFPQVEDEEVIEILKI